MWKEIPKYEDYEVSNTGIIRRVRGGIKKLPFFPKVHLHKTGYLYVHLICGEKIKFMMIHRAIMETFVRNGDEKRQVNHINGIKTDNRLENLEWATPKENNEHAIKTGLNKQGTPKHGSWRTVRDKKCRCFACQEARMTIRKKEKENLRRWRMKTYGSTSSIRPEKRKKILFG